MHSNETISFSQSKIYIFLTKYGGRLYSIAVLIIVITALIGFKSSFQYYRLLYLLIILTIIVCIVGYHLRRIACTIKFDFKKKSISFITCRGDIFESLFVDIKQIQVRRNIKFVMKNNKKLIYNGDHDKALLNCIKRIWEMRDE